MENEFLIAIYFLPILMFAIFVGVAIGKDIWRKKNGLRRSLFKESIMGGGLWFSIWVIVAVYFGHRFYEIGLDPKKAEVVIKYFPSKTVKVRYQDLEVISILKPKPKALSIRRGWALEVRTTAGELFKSLNTRPSQFEGWNRDRITRKDLYTHGNLFE